MNENKSIQVYKQNSPLKSPPSQANVYNVSGLAFDQQNNLWVANYGSPQQLHVLKADGNWKSFTIPFALNENAVSQIVIDDVNQKWIISPKGNGLICFSDGNTIDNTGDDHWRMFKMGIGNGNLPDNNVLSIVKDKDDFIWVGTSAGVAIIPCLSEIFSNTSCEAVIPIVQSGGFNNFLFHDEQVQCMAVDGGNRKWVGSRNGIWLISPDGEQTIYHFTEDNSPLLSNDVRKITIDGTTGEVFFSTAKGISSFRSTATEGGPGNSNVLVYPNPVPPGYLGQIAIRGLVNNAIVKITELDGRLVYQTRALGGQAIWNGQDYHGRRVASGIYLVMVTDDNRKENLATKIVFLH
jgi:ligand-binding sensor domain-containing protein